MARNNMNFDLNFDFSSLTFETQTEQEIREIPKLNIEPVMFENAEAMVDSIDYSKEYIAFVSGNFIFGDFIEALVFKKELKPDIVYLTTLGMNKNNIDSIVNLTDYLGTKQVNLIISHYFAGVERHGLIPYMEQEFKNRPINVGVLQQHAKIALIKSTKGDVLICGSANLSSSNNVEQFIIMHSPTAISFIQNKLEMVMNKFKVIDGLEGAKMNWKYNKGNTGRKAFETLKGDAE